MVDSVVNTLGAGSGIDITSLVNQLVDAQFSAKTRAINTQNQKVSAQISGVSQLKSSITDFAAGLKSLATGGLLTTAPTTSNPAIVKATALPAAKLTGLATTIEVQQLAQAQSVASAAAAMAVLLVGLELRPLEDSRAAEASSTLGSLTRVKTSFAFCSEVSVGITSTTS